MELLLKQASKIISLSFGKTLKLFTKGTIHVAIHHPHAQIQPSIYLLHFNEIEDYELFSSLLKKIIS